MGIRRKHQRARCLLLALSIKHQAAPLALMTAVFATPPSMVFTDPIPWNSLALCCLLCVRSTDPSKGTEIFERFHKDSFLLDKVSLYSCLVWNLLQKPCFQEIQLPLSPEGWD